MALVGAVEATELKKHLDSCAECRRTFSNVARGLTSDADASVHVGASPAGATLIAGEMVDEHIVAQPLGAGAMGIVYAAYDPVLDREVALKLARQSDNAALMARLRREARALGRLSHPAIVPVHRLGQHSDGRLYYSMRRLGGTTLADTLACCANGNERLRMLPHFVRAMELTGGNSESDH